MKRLLRLLPLLVVAAGLFACSGCAVVGVNVWDRDILSKPSMQLDNGSVNRALDDHIYFSKEASSGGRGFGGGGCGCN